MSIAVLKGSDVVRVAVIYHMWPHYREAVVGAMQRSDRISYDFYGSGESYQGIKHADMSVFKSFFKTPLLVLGGFIWQSKVVKASVSNKYDAIIFLGDPHFVSTWCAAGLARLRRTSVIYWTHGWLRRETGVRRLMRTIFLRLANRVLTYGERARRIGISMGFPAERISVIYNSLDVIRADEIISGIESDALTDVDPRTLFVDSALPLIVCSSRITSLCRFDLLIDAAALLQERGRPINILLVGDGPSRQALSDLAVTRCIPVHFFGACYDENVIGQLIYKSDLTVSPGKIGLTAMHSLMYGTPAITHDNLNEQMPEVEAIIPGITGQLFAQNDTLALANVIDDWTRNGRSRAEVRAACRHVIHDRWNPTVQANLIEAAILEVTNA